MVREKLGTPER